MQGGAWRLHAHVPPQLVPGLDLRAVRDPEGAAAGCARLSAEAPHAAGWAMTGAGSRDGGSRTRKVRRILGLLKSQRGGRAEHGRPGLLAQLMGYEWYLTSCLPVSGELMQQWLQHVLVWSEVLIACREKVVLCTVTGTSMLGMLRSESALPACLK